MGCKDVALSKIRFARFARRGRRTLVFFLTPSKRTTAYGSDMPLVSREVRLWPETICVPPRIQTAG